MIVLIVVILKRDSLLLLLDHSDSLIAFLLRRDRDRLFVALSSIKGLLCILAVLELVDASQLLLLGEHEGQLRGHGHFIVLHALFHLLLNHLLLLLSIPRHSPLLQVPQLEAFLVGLFLEHFGEGRLFLFGRRGLPELGELAYMGVGVLLLHFLHFGLQLP